MRAAATTGRQRACASSAVRSPTARSTSWRPSAFAARVRSLRSLEVGLDLLERARVDQLAQLLLAEQLSQQVAVEREAAARRSAFGVSPSYM